MLTDNQMKVWNLDLFLYKCSVCGRHPSLQPLLHYQSNIATMQKYMLECTHVPGCAIAIFYVVVKRKITPCWFLLPPWIKLKTIDFVFRAAFGSVLWSACHLYSRLKLHISQMSSYICSRINHTNDFRSLLKRPFFNHLRAKLRK